MFWLNKSKQLRQRDSLIKSELNITQENKIWNVNDGNIDTLNTAIQESNHCDTILINNGTFTLEDDNIFNNKQLQIIGNENVKIDFDKDDAECWALGDCKLYFKNLQLLLSNDLVVCTNSSLYIENCEVTSECWA